VARSETFLCRVLGCFDSYVTPRSALAGSQPAAKTWQLSEGGSEGDSVGLHWIRAREAVLTKSLTLFQLAAAWSPGCRTNALIF
jgi:hypothetical protein